MKLFGKKQSELPRRRIASGDNINAGGSNVFKRNRTLTGTTSNHLNTTVSANADLESPRQHVHHMSIKRRKLSAILLATFLIICILGIFICNYTASLSVSVSGTGVLKQVDFNRYNKVIQDYLNANPTNRLKPFLDEANITKYVSSKLPEVEKVSQGMITGIGKTDFVLTMRKPVAGWIINDKQYFVDSKGVAFEYNYFESPSVQIIDNSGASQQAGTMVASKRFLSFVGKVVSLAQNSGYTVTQAVLPPDTTRQLELHVKECSYYIKLSIDRSAGEQIEDMGRAVKYIIDHSMSVTYIDIRVSGKAYYK